MYRPQIEISLSHTLALDTNRKASCLLLALSQLALGANLVLVYNNILPVYLLTFSIIILLIERIRKKPLALQALKFCAWRVILHITAISAVVMLQYTTPNENHMLHYWNFLIFILTPLSIYDGFALAEGKIGFKILNRKK